MSNLFPIGQRPDKKNSKSLDLTQNIFFPRQILKRFTFRVKLSDSIFCPPPQHNIILFELDFDVKFPLLRLLQFLIDLKSTIFKALT